MRAALFASNTYVCMRTRVDLSLVDSPTSGLGDRFSAWLALFALAASVAALAAVPAAVLSAALAAIASLGYDRMPCGTGGR